MKRALIPILLIVSALISVREGCHLQHYQSLTSAHSVTQDSLDRLSRDVDRIGNEKAVYRAAWLEQLRLNEERDSLILSLPSLKD